MRATINISTQESYDSIKGALLPILYQFRKEAEEELAGHKKWLGDTDPMEGDDTGDYYMMAEAQLAEVNKIIAAIEPIEVETENEAEVEINGVRV